MRTGLPPGLPGDTIAAISTPLGPGGIGIVRISGPQARAIAQQIFRRKKGRASILPQRLTLGEIFRPEDQTVLDEVLLVYMAQPKTYTREDVVEIQCHSGALILKEILQTVLNCGARLAEPGEFTKRAFLNGRLDLTQAEAVMDLIHSQTRRALDLANRQLSGRLAAKIKGLRESLWDLLTRMEAGIDFPEEEIPELPPEEVTTSLQAAVDELAALLHTYEEGKRVRYGITAVIVGKPNVGKSSLLNALLKEDRAIVTPFPGTTRDIIEEAVAIQGIPVRLIDTAGLRPAQDPIEEEGVRRTRECLAAADLVLWVVDGSAPLTGDDLDILPLVEGKKTIGVLNKNDLPQHLRVEDLQVHLPRVPCIPLSALQGTGLERLKEAMERMILDGQDHPAGEVILSNLRHQQALTEARKALIQALEAMRNRLPDEFVVADLRQGLEALGEMTGDSISEDVLDRIFDQFCIGK
jgi:tRNA modification GTPase